MIAKTTAERDDFERWYAPKFASGSVGNMPLRRNGEYVSAQQQVAWLAYAEGRKNEREARDGQTQAP